MVRKNSLYGLALFGWAVAVFGATVAIFSGQAAPFVTPSMLPVDGPFALVVVAGGLFLFGVVVIGQVKRRAWRRAGRRANLTPQGGGLFGKSDLVGTTNGRSVRARTVKRKTSGGGESGSSKTTYTIVEADLREPAEHGLLIARGDGNGLTDVADAPVTIETEAVGDFEAVGSSRGLAGDVLTSRARDALREPTLLEAVRIGKVSDVLLEGIPDSDGVLGGRLTDGIKHKLEKQMVDDPTTVRTETKGLLLDGEELERQVAAVVAVADGFEDASLERATAGD